MKFDSKTVSLLIVVALAFGGGGFYGGMKYQAAKTPARGTQGAFQRGGTGIDAGGAAARARFGNGGFVNGQIVSKDPTSLTIKLADGGSRIIFVTASTQIAKVEAATLDDLKEGATVLVTGDANADGSVNARMIQSATGSLMMGFGRGGQNGGTRPPVQN